MKLSQKSIYKVKQCPCPDGRWNVIPSHKEIRQLFHRLMKAYGRRGWWPCTYGGAFEIVCGAILTQNTSWKNVEKALRDMREAGLWSWRVLSEVDTVRLEEVVRSSGYFRVKSKKLKIFASMIMQEYEGDIKNLFRLDQEELRKRLLSVWGIGEETADDIILYAAEKPSFVIDKYTMRIVDRLGWDPKGKRYADYQRLFTERLKPNAAVFNEFHALLDRHGSTVCRKIPRCGECQLQDICAFGRRALDTESTSA